MSHLRVPFVWLNGVTQSSGCVQEWPPSPLRDKVALSHQSVLSSELSQRYPPEARSDLVLFGLVQGLDHLYQQLERLFETEFSDSRQPEWTS